MLPGGSAYVDLSFGDWRKNRPSREISTWKSPETRKEKVYFRPTFRLLLWCEEPFLLWNFFGISSSSHLRRAIGCQPFELLDWSSAQCLDPTQNQLNQNSWGLVPGVGIFKNLLRKCEYYSVRLRITNPQDKSWEALIYQMYRQVRKAEMLRKRIGKMKRLWRNDLWDHIHQLCI